MIIIYDIFRKTIFFTYYIQNFKMYNIVFIVVCRTIIILCRMRLQYDLIFLGHTHCQYIQTLKKKNLLFCEKSFGKT